MPTTARVALVLAIGACGGARDASSEAGTSETDDPSASVTNGSTVGPDSDGSDGCAPSEDCDGIDNDCDGTIDEDCTCMPEQTRPCYAGADETIDVGVCQSGVERCQDGSWSGDCEGQVVPTEEACNRVDDDCDGVADEACGGWTVQIPSSPNGVRDVVFDGVGNVFVTGGVFGGTDFGAGHVDTQGGDDGFVASYAPDGSHRWARLFGGADQDEGIALALAPTGDVWVAGQVGRDPDFGDGVVAGFGVEDGFVARFTSVGEPVSARVFGSDQGDAATGVAIDGSGRIVVIGQIGGLASLGGADLDAATGRTVVAQYSPIGDHQWSLHAGSGEAEADTPLGVVADADGNVYVTGEVAGLASYGGDALDAGGKADIFLVKLDAGGAHVWSQKFGDSDFVANVGYSIALTPAGNLVLTGLAIPAIDFGGGTLPGNGSLVVASFDPDGTHLWSLRSEGTQEEFAYGRGVAVADDGTVLVVGYYDQHVQLGSVALPVSDEIDVLLFALDEAGTPSWGERLISPIEDDHDYGHAVAVGPAGAYAVAGAFRTDAFVRVFGLAR